MTEVVLMPIFFQNPLSVEFECLNSEVRLQRHIRLIVFVRAFVLEEKLDYCWVFRHCARWPRCMPDRYSSLERLEWTGLVRDQPDLCTGAADLFRHCARWPRCMPDRYSSQERLEWTGLVRDQPHLCTGAADLTALK